MVKDDHLAEVESITIYQHLIELVEKEDDVVSQRMLEQILKETEEHTRDLETLLGE